jgi:hypothetical protein
MPIVVSPNDPGSPESLKYKFLLWVQYKLPKVFLFFGLVSLVLLIAGWMLDVTYSSIQTDYTWFQRFGAVVVGWSIFIGMLQQSTFNHSNALKVANVLAAYKDEFQEESQARGKQAHSLWITEALSLFAGTLVWAFGDMVTDRFLHCGQWMCV